ncbi:MULTISPECIES: helix-turn-helix domain-containing protein [unclassified Haladaptatus]|uniref:helix-turn-helix domain-containing protein n=1 Tax=unclassified Haladaptatus TaxID=2622732 RepID=UPI00209C3155|nr:MULTISPECIES: helix-turn-helix domain-containing protein [unclassified Haladaptatus]MCO8245825.1 helix-turn-helix domain-containing protein [Haladaptatus sp. AB643]MCO8256172.1 helix-turn-helix domain-containing protein [Haladaptatus sp. AB618]
MSTIAIVRLPASDFALEATLERVPGVTFEVERVVAPEAERVMPYVWATADPDQFDALHAALEDDPTTDGIELLADLDDEWLFRMEWIGKTRFVIHILVEESGTIIDANGSGDEWKLRILFPTRDALGATYQYCEEHGIPLEIEQIYRLDESPRRGQYGLTKEQYDTLVAALEEGYYDIPRTISGEELSRDLGISHQALSERLRRAYTNLIANALVIGEGELE